MRPESPAPPADGLPVNERSVEVPWARQRIGGARRVLDVGCSTSDYLADLARAGRRRGRRVYGLDPDAPRPIRNVGIAKGTILAPPFPPESFDLILCISTVEHIGLPVYGQHEFPHGDTLALRQARRLLAPGGRLLLTVPFGHAQVNPWFRIYDRTGLRRLRRGFRTLSTTFYRLRPDPSTSSGQAPSTSSSPEANPPGRVSVWSPSAEGQAGSTLRQAEGTTEYGPSAGSSPRANPPGRVAVWPPPAEGPGSYEVCRSWDLRDAGYDFEHMRAEGVALAELTPATDVPADADPKSP